MKVLFFTASFCDLNHKEFSKDTSGFGYMVKDIMISMADICEAYCATHQVTNGYLLRGGVTILRNTKKDIFLSCRIIDIFKAVAVFFKVKENIRSRLRNGYYYINSGSFKRAIKKVKPDIIHIHGLSMQYKPIIELCEKMKIPYVTTLHGIIGLGDVNIKNVAYIDRWYEYEGLKFLANHKRDVTVVSSGTKNRIIESYKLPEDNIHVVLNGTNIPEKIEKIKTSKKEIICIGSVSERKNQTQLIRAFSLLPDSIRNNCILHIIGSIPDGLDLNEMVRKLHLENNVICHGFIPREEITSYLKKASLNVSVSLDEGFGMPIIEGYAYGVPALFFSDIDAAKDLYNKESALMIYGKNDEDVARYLQEALEKEWSASDIIQISKKYSIGEMAKNYYRIYELTIKRFRELQK